MSYNIDMQAAFLKPEGQALRKIFSDYSYEPYTVKALRTSLFLIEKGGDPHIPLVQCCHLFQATATRIPETREFSISVVSIIERNMPMDLDNTPPWKTRTDTPAAEWMEEIAKRPITNVKLAIDTLEEFSTKIRNIADVEFPGHGPYSPAIELPAYVHIDVIKNALVKMPSKSEKDWNELAAVKMGQSAINLRRYKADNAAALEFNNSLKLSPT